MLLREFMAQVRDDPYAPISEDLGINIRSVVYQLPESHRLWDSHAKKIPDYIATFRSKDIFRSMPVLHATKEILPDFFLLRAAILVSGFAHAYYYPQGYNHEDPLPDAIIIPLLEIAKRINKKSANNDSDIEVYVGRTYMEDFLSNWVITNQSINQLLVSKDQLRLDNLKLLAPYFDNQEESISTLITGPIMQAKFSGAFKHIASLQEELLKPHPVITSIINYLGSIESCIRETTKAFMLMKPTLGEHYVDQVIWPKTTPSMGRVHPNEAPNTGADSLIFHILDKFIARKDYESVLGKNILYRFDFIPEHYQKCISIVEEIGRQLLSFIQENSDDEVLRESYRTLVLAYTGNNNSLLDNHRKKAYGYAKMAFLGGRLITNGNQEGHANTVATYRSALTPWGKLHRSFQAGKEERLNVLRTLNISHEQQQQLAEMHPSANTGRVFKHYEVSKNNNPARSLGIFNNRVYDITNLIKTHPGGHRVLQSLAGTDMTQELQEAHATNLPQIEALLQKYYIGYIERNIASPEITAFVDRWSPILFLIAEIQNNIRGIWSFDKSSVGDSKREMPFHFVMKTLDIIFGKEGYIDSLLKISDQDLYNEYQTRALRHWKKTEDTEKITILNLGQQAMQYGKDEIKNLGLRTLNETLIQNMRIYELYVSLINLSLTFLEKLKSDITTELDHISEPVDDSTIPNILKTELTLFLKQVDSVNTAKLIEKINRKTKKTNYNPMVLAACFLLASIALDGIFESNNLSLEILVLLSIAGYIAIAQVNSHRDVNYQNTAVNVEPDRVSLCPLGYS